MWHYQEQLTPVSALCVGWMVHGHSGIHVSWAVENGRAGPSLSCCVCGLTVLLAVRVGDRGQGAPVSGELWSLKCRSPVR